MENIFKKDFSKQLLAFWPVVLLLVRLWLGRTMINGGQSVLRITSSQELRDFFINWFGNELGFPFPLAMATIAKGIEFFGGILILFGFFTRTSASLIAFVMLVATLSANLNYTGQGKFIQPDGLITISSFLFALILMIWGSGKYGLDGLMAKIR